MKIFKSFILIFLLIKVSSGFSAHKYIVEGEFGHFLLKKTREMLELFCEVLPDDPVILEAGGHFGEHTVKFAKQWPNSTVISFEPLPGSYANLLEETKDYPQVHAYNLALSDKEGLATFYVCHGTEGLARPNELGASSLLKPTPQMQIHYQGPRIQVNCVVLDKFLPKLGVKHIDFMWLDLEGHELSVLQGAYELLKTVKIIYTEINFYPFREGTTQYRDLEKFLREAGFIPIALYYQKRLQGDAIFIRKELLPLLKDS